MQMRRIIEYNKRGERNEQHFSSEKFLSQDLELCGARRRRIPQQRSNFLHRRQPARAPIYFA